MSTIWWIGTAVALVAASVMVAELGTRRWLRARRRYYLWPPNQVLELEFDPELARHIGPRARFAVNSDGHRGEPVPRNVERLCRVLVFGSSATECYFLDQEASWPMVLQRILERPENLRKLGASYVHVANLGRPSVEGEALDLILRVTLERTGHVAMIVIMVGASAVVNWLETGAPERPVSLAPLVSDLFAWHPEGPFAWTAKRTALAEVVRRVRDCTLHRVVRRSGVGKSLLRARLMRREATEIRNTVGDSSFVMASFEKHLHRAVSRAKAAADRVIIVRQPWFQKDEFSQEEMACFWNGSVGNAYEGEVSTFYSNEVMFRLLDEMDVCVVRVSEALGVEQVEIRTQLEPSLKTYYDHIHLTPSGSAKVADLIAKAILAEKHGRKQLPSVTTDAFA